MLCSNCVYYSGDQRCDLYGELESLKRWELCDEYIDRSTRYLPNPLGCCGIYNYPYPATKDNTET